MNRLFATLAVFAMMMLAIAVSLNHTLDQGIDPDAGAIALHLIAAVGLIALSAAVSLRHLRAREQTSAATRKSFELVHALRRLLSAVWS